MKSIKNILMITSVAIIVATACEDRFNELLDDPNRPTEVTPQLVLRKVITDMYNAPWDRGNQIQQWNQYWCCNYNYYGTNEYNWNTTNSFNYYATLKDIAKMEEEAKRLGMPDVNPYSVLGKFLRAYFFDYMSMKMGDIPMSSALKGKDDIYPEYDNQKAVYQQILNLLEEANNEATQLITNKEGAFEGDIYYDNQLEKWQKAINSFRLRVLINLSKKADDADLNVKEQFASIVGNESKYPVFTGSDDNMAYRFNSVTNYYPLNPNNFGFYALRYNTSNTYIGLLKSLKDPRLFVTADPAPYFIDTLGLSPCSFEAFQGADPGESLDDMSSRVQHGDYSLINYHRYYTTYTAEDYILIGYPELCFNIAEAINRGWLTGNAEEWYVKGIESSMDFYDIGENTELTVYHPLTHEALEDTIASVSDYIDQPAVSYKGDNPDGLTQILNQKYIALFQNSDLQAYFNYRRTGVPAFTSGPGTGNSGRIPVRFAYPVSERTTNKENWQAAVRSQFGGEVDDINTTIWIVK